MIKKIAVLTSGGDAPGMNAAIRSVVRSARSFGLEVVGIHEGYKGLVEGGDNYETMTRRSVTDIITRGGTILGSARLPEFPQPEVRDRGIQTLKDNNIDGLVVIGGDGTYTGAKRLHDHGIKVVGIPGTIDNDIANTDYTIGFDTCVNTVVECIDKLRDTCGSHHRCAVVEVMGRYCGDIARAAGLATGAEFVVTNTQNNDLQTILDQTKYFKEQGKRHPIIIVTEHLFDVFELAKEIEAYSGMETRATVLGHIQRGGKPSSYDRILASRLGLAAVEALMNGQSGVCIGVQSNKIVSNPFEEVIGKSKELFNEYEDIIKLIS